MKNTYFWPVEFLEAEEKRKKGKKKEWINLDVDVGWQEEDDDKKEGKEILRKIFKYLFW